MKKDIGNTVINMLKGIMPRQVVVQITTACNATCKQCSYGSQRCAPSTIPEEKVYEIIDKAAAAGFPIISFTGGEPFLIYDKLLRYLRYAGKAGLKYIRTGSNGVFLHAPYMKHGKSSAFHDAVSSTADELVSTPLRNLWISIDSADIETHEANRGLKGLVNAIALSVPVFEERGLYLAVNLGISRLIDGPCPGWEKDGFYDPDKFNARRFEERYRNGFRKFFRLAEELGFTIVGVCYPMAVEEGKYGATSDFLTNYLPQEQNLLFNVFEEESMRFRARLRITAPLLVCQFLKHNEHPIPCGGGRDYFFISAQDGCAYPCGYLTVCLGEFKDLDMDMMSRQARTCKKCNWQCFYDPDQIVGTIRETLFSPSKLLSWLSGKNELCNRLMFDVKYFMASGFYDGRKPPDYTRLAHLMRSWTTVQHRA